MSEPGIGNVITGIPDQIGRAYRDHQNKAGCTYGIAGVVVKTVCLAALPFEIILHAFIGVRYMGFFRLGLTFLWLGLAGAHHLFLGYWSRYYDASTGMINRPIDHVSESYFLGTHPFFFLYYLGLTLVFLVVRAAQSDSFQARGMAVYSWSSGTMSLIWYRLRIPRTIVVTLIEPSLVAGVGYLVRDLDRPFSIYVYVGAASLLAVNVFGEIARGMIALDHHDSIAESQDAQLAMQPVVPEPYQVQAGQVPERGGRSAVNSEELREQIEMVVQKEVSRARGETASEGINQMTWDEKASLLSRLRDELENNGSDECSALAPAEE